MAQHAQKTVDGPKRGPRLERAPSRVAASHETPLWIAIADSEDARLLIARGDETHRSIADSDETLPSIADIEMTTFIGRVFFHPDARWRWTMFLVWPLIWVVAILVSVELGPLMH